MALNTVSDYLNAAFLKGQYRRSTCLTVTAATTQCGDIIAHKMIEELTIPSVGSGVSGFYLDAQLISHNAANHPVIVGLSYLLGQLDYSTGSSSSLAAMPTKPVIIDGTSYSEQTAALMSFAVVTTQLGTSSSNLTIGYTNENGDTSRSCTITFPASTVAVDSAFYLGNRLQAGDFAIREVTSLSKSTGASGVVKIFGLLPFAILTPTHLGCSQPSNFLLPLPRFLAETNDKIAFYRFGATAVPNGMAINVIGTPVI